MHSQFQQLEQVGDIFKQQSSMQKQENSVQANVSSIGNAQAYKPIENGTTSDSLQRQNLLKISIMNNQSDQKASQKKQNNTDYLPFNILRKKILFSSQSENACEQIIVKQQKHKTKFLMSPIHIITIILTVFFFGFTLGSIFNTRIYNHKKILNAKKVQKMSYDMNLKLTKIIKQKDSIIKLLLTNIQSQQNALISQDIQIIKTLPNENYTSLQDNNKMYNLSELLRQYKNKAQHLNNQGLINQDPKEPIMDHFLNDTMRIAGQIQPSEKFQKSLVQFGIILFIFIIFGSASPIQCCELFFALLVSGILGFLMIQTVEPLI